MAQRKKSSKSAGKSAKGMKVVEQAIEQATGKGEAKATPPVRVESRYAGSTLIAKATMAESRRQAGSTRWNSLDIITKAGAKGISFEEYKKAGGITRYVGWFVRREQIEARPAK